MSEAGVEEALEIESQDGTKTVIEFGAPRIQVGVAGRGSPMKILVATDGSRAGLAAVKFASGLATHQQDAELIVLTVCPDSGAAGNGQGPLRRAEKALADAARECAAEAIPAARFELIHSRSADEVPEAISRQADRLRADLVVVGSEGRESLTEWVVGGTALRLIYVARRPVTVVRAPRLRSRTAAPVGKTNPQTDSVASCGGGPFGWMVGVKGERHEPHSL